MAKILVIDDDKSFLSLVERLLKKSKHEVFTAERAMDGMAILRTETVDLALVDVTLPEMDGFSILKIIKKNPSFTCPVVFLTARKDPANVTRALKEGVNGYIIKPIGKDFLVKVQELLVKFGKTQQQTG